MHQDFPISASVLILSDDGRSMLKNSIWIPVKPESELEIQPSKFDAIISDKELLQKLRKYFLLLSHFSDVTLQNYSVADECSSFAQSYFIEKRKKEGEFIKSQEEQGVDPKVMEHFNQTRTDQHTFHHWLVLARLMAISQGHQTMQTDHFKRALVLEEARVERTNAIKAKKMQK